MRALAATFVALATCCIAASPAFAVLGDADQADYEVTETSNGYTVALTAWSDGGGVSVGTNPLAGCVIVGGLSGAQAIDLAGGTGIAIEITNPEMTNAEDTVTFVFISCPERIFDGFGWAVWQEGEAPPDPVIDALVEAARAAVVLPPLTPESAPDGLETPFLTQLPVWLWVPAESWVPVTGSASLPELGLTITATATPDQTMWRTGAEENGEAMMCEAGTPWEAGLDDDATDCSATFGETTAPGTTIDLTVTTSYGVTFACTPGLCGPGAITPDTFEITVARPVTVTEARGVISS